MKDPQYEYEIEVSRQGDTLVAGVYEFRGQIDDWHSPPCRTPEELWWYVDRYFLWEIECFPARWCSKRAQLREEFLKRSRELLEEMEMTP